MRKLLWMIILAGLMVLFGAIEDGIVVGIGSAQAFRRAGRSTALDPGSRLRLGVCIVTF
jgi:hypothetical protein